MRLRARFSWSQGFTLIILARFVLLLQLNMVENLCILWHLTGWNICIGNEYLCKFAYAYRVAKRMYSVYRQYLLFEANLIYSIGLRQILFSFTLWIDKRALWEWKLAFGETRWNIHFEEYYFAFFGHRT